MLGTHVTGSSTHGVPGDGVVITGEKVWTYAFVPSARAVHTQPEINGVRGYDFSRLHRETFSVGYAENVTIETGGAANWQWRRLAFRMKNSPSREAFPTQTLYQYVADVVPPPGYVRALYDFSLDDNARTTLYYEIFQGSQGVDWKDIFNARLNTTKVVPIYDRTIQISGGNDAAHWKRRKFWHPTRKRLVYDDKESGDHKVQGEDSHFSANGTHSMGDLWILDFFACANGGATNQLRFVPQGCYYWHER